MINYSNHSNYSSLLDAAGATLLLISFMIPNGNALIATMTATFHANRNEITNERSVVGGESRSEVRK